MNKKPTIGYGILFKDEVEEHIKLTNVIIPTLGTFQYDSITILMDNDYTQQSIDNYLDVQENFNTNILNLYLSHELTINGHIISSQTKRELILFMEMFNSYFRSEVNEKYLSNIGEFGGLNGVYSIENPNSIYDIHELLKTFKMPGLLQQECREVILKVFGIIRSSYFFRKLDNFANQKNALNELIKNKVVNGNVFDYNDVLSTDLERDILKDNNLYIFNLDSDEYYKDHLLVRNEIDKIIQQTGCNGVWLKRTNVIEFSNKEEKDDFEQKCLGKNGWGWTITKDESTDLVWSVFNNYKVVVNYPDNQFRIFKMDTLKGDENEVKWVGDVHERVSTFNYPNNIEYPLLTFDDEMNYSLQHIKSFKKQFLQNMKYNDMIMFDYAQDLVNVDELDINHTKNNVLPKVRMIEQGTDYVIPQNRLIVCDYIYDELVEDNNEMLEWFDNLVKMNQAYNTVIITEDIKEFVFLKKRYGKLINCHLCKTSTEYNMFNVVQYNKILNVYKCPIHNVYKDYLIQKVSSNVSNLEELNG